MPKSRFIWYYGISFILNHIFFSFGWIWVQGKCLWRLQNTEMKTTFDGALCPQLTGNNMANSSKVSLKPKTAVYWITFHCFFFCCYYLRKHWTWLLCFHNLYSGKFKFFHLARIPAVVSSKKYLRLTSVSAQIGRKTKFQPLRNPLRQYLRCEKVLKK